MYIDLGNTGNNINFGSTGGGDCNIEPRTEYTITKNGSYPINPDDDYDAMEGVDVIVSVPEMKLKDVQSVSYTENGSYNVLPDEGYDGMSKVNVDVNVPQSKLQATRQVTLNQTESGSTIITPADGYDGMERVSLTVNVPTEEKTATYTANGEYTIEKSSDKAGMTKATVTVDVPTANVQDMKIVNQEVNTSGLYVFSPDEGYDAMKVVRANLTIPSTPVASVDLDTGISFAYSNMTTLPFALTGGGKRTAMKTMFNECEILKSLDLSGINTSSVTSMRGMFYACKCLTSLDLSNFNTSKLTDTYGMFSRCFILRSLDLSNFDTSKVTDTEDMFYLCNSLTTVKVVNCNDDTKQKILTQLQKDLSSKTWTLGDDGIITRS